MPEEAYDGIIMIIIQQSKSHRINSYRTKYVQSYVMLCCLKIIGFFIFV